MKFTNSYFYFSRFVKKKRFEIQQRDLKNRYKTQKHPTVNLITTYAISALPLLINSAAAASASTTAEAAAIASSAFSQTFDSLPLELEDSLLLELEDSLPPVCYKPVR